MSAFIQLERSGWIFRDETHDCYSRAGFSAHGLRGFREGQEPQC